MSDVLQLSDGRKDGVSLGQSTTDKISFYNGAPVAQGAALTAQLTTITPASGEGTPDYAIQALTNSSGFGFVTQQEGTTTLYVIKNLQERVAQLEARLEALNLIAAN